MSKDYIVTLALPGGNSEFRTYAIATCEGKEFDEDKVTHVLPIDLYFTEKGGKVEFGRRLTLEQFEKEWDMWIIKSVEGDSLTDFMEVISPVVRVLEKDEWKPSKELTADDFEPADE